MSKAEEKKAPAAKKTTKKTVVPKKAAPGKKDPVKKQSTTPKKKAAAEAPQTGKGFEFVQDLDQYLYDKGVHYDIFRKLGAHPSVKDGKKGIHFAVWAPHAAAVHLIGEFNGWNEDSIAMERLDPSGIWEAFCEEAQLGQMYKYLVFTADGRKLYKADPYANQAEKRPGTASVIADISTIRWSDDAWMKKKASFVQDSSPISIYECH
ncbi:MAG: 1,4-alpha-glucan branching enzyme, partial [Lachnospiraceae bacterium]|nr:1,4-alpha-glucan branching enzyme [Lachnospiraceae bacterium]